MKINQLSPANRFASDSYTPPQPQRTKTESKPTNVRNVLLGLGAVLCCMAALLFVAVSWERLGVGGKALILLSVTGITALTAFVSFRRGLIATAETLSVVAVGLAVIDAVAARSANLLGLGGPEAWIYWIAVSTIIAGLTIACRVVVPIQSPGYIGLLAAQVPVYLFVVNVISGTAAGATPFLAAQMVALALCVRLLHSDALFGLRIAAAACVVIQGVIVTFVTVFVLADGAAVGGWVLLASVFASTFVAATLVLSARLAKGNADTVQIADIAALMIGTAIAFSTVVGIADGHDVYVTYTAIAILAAILHSKVRGTIAPATGLVYLSFLVVGLGGLSPLYFEALGAFIRHSTDIPSNTQPLPVLIGLGLAAISMAVAGWLKHNRPMSLRSAYLGFAAAVIAPEALNIGPEISAALFVTLALASFWSARVQSVEVFPIVGWLSISAALIIPALEGGGLAAAFVATLVVGLWVNFQPIRFNRASVLLTSLLLLGTTASIADLFTNSLQVVLFATFVAGLVIAAIVDRYRHVVAAHLFAIVPASTWSAVVLLSFVNEQRWLLAGLGATVVVTAIMALQTNRRYFAWISSLLFVCFIWVRLGIADIDVAEAYATPLAVWLLIFGWYYSKETSGRSSWVTYGPGLGLLSIVGMVCLLSDDGVVRAGLYGAGALSVVLWGAAKRLQAPLALGSTIVIFDGFLQLAPYADNVPRWLIVGAVGILLVGLGATYEKRLRELDGVRKKFRELA